VAFGERGIRVEYAPGYDPVESRPDRGLIDEAVAIAREAEVVVLMAGLPGTYESEGFDRADLHLPRQQEDLIEAVCRANPRTVVALSNGSAIVMPWRDCPAAIVESYLGGQASGGALVDILYGDAEPGGRLAETFPVRQEDVASDRWFPGDPHQVEYREGLRVGYRHFTTAGVEPLFAFGHGLGYTTFDLGEPALAATAEAGEPVRLSVPVTNTGARSGRTVVQAYLQDRSGRVTRPRRELAGFAAVELAAGESRIVDIEIAPRAFAFFDVDDAAWLIPDGQYAIEVGWSSVDIVHTAVVQMRGGFTGSRRRAMSGESDAEFARLLRRPIPSARPVKPYTRISTIGEISGNPIGRLVRKVVLRISGHDSAEDPVTAIMIERSVDEMPLRGIALFSQGKVSLGMIDGLVDAVNGRPDRSITRMLRAVPTMLRRGRR
jgi:beta-glucosidase